MPSFFDKVEVAAPIEVFNLSAKFRDDPVSNKVNLGVGAYRTDEGKPWVLPVVHAVEIQMAEDATLNHEYLPVAGLPDYTNAAAKLLVGADSKALTENRVGAIQAIGGTGALRIGLDFLKSQLGCDTVYVSNPTWGNHKGIANSLGYKHVKEYDFWDASNCSFNKAATLAALKSAAPRSVVLLHMVAHNPTGMDPSPEQWNEIAAVMRERNLFVFFDCAYQGFASGDLDKDAASLRAFLAQGFEMFAAQSFSKNFGLYNERVGNLVYVCQDSGQMQAMKSQLELVVRKTWSNSSSHGARIVATILNNPTLLAEWKDCVQLMANRIKEMRVALQGKLKALGSTRSWDHITQQQGMFSYLGINPKQVEHIIKKHHIYLLSSGRINMCGVTTHNVEYIAQAIHDAVTNA